MTVSGAALLWPADDAHRLASPLAAALVNPRPLHPAVSGAAPLWPEDAAHRYHWALASAVAAAEEEVSGAALLCWAAEDAARRSHWVLVVVESPRPLLHRAVSGAALLC